MSSSGRGVDGGADGRGAGRGDGGKGAGRCSARADLLEAGAELLVLLLQKQILLQSVGVVVIAGFGVHRDYDVCVKMSS